MPKVRIHQIAKELNLTHEKIVEYLSKRGIIVKNQFQALDEETIAFLRKSIIKEDEKARARLASKSTPVIDVKPVAKKRSIKKEAAPAEIEPEEAAAEEEEEEVVEVEKTAVDIPEGATVKEYAEAVGQSPNDLIKMLLNMGEMCTINQVMSGDAIELVSEELNIEPVLIMSEIEPEEEFHDEESQLEPRPPVVTIMGHVDHGKTSLLDAVRETDVISGEAGGITQHIGAYHVTHNEKSITFIDTPGHEAFTAMRARGASVTDIAVLVVAADDGVMPQTVEAIDHAQAANVPLIVAVNKIDKSNADPEKIKQGLTEYELIPEEWGGETIFVEVSAKKKTNINDLLDMILLTAELRELKANPNTTARGVVIEAELDKGRGPVATLLVQRGTIRVGDPAVTGTAYGKVRALVDEHGKRVKAAGPGMPIEVLGLSAVPSAGDSFMVVGNEREARRIGEDRALKKRQREQMRKHVTLDDLFDRIKGGDVHELRLVVKGDVQGSIEALRESLEKLDQSEVTISIIHKGVGAISETDVMLAAASDAIIIGYNVRPDPKAKDMAEQEKVDLRTYRVIYQAVEDIQKACIGILPPRIEERDVGRVEVREVFKVPKIGFVAGSYVAEGKVARGSLARLVRDGVVVYEGKVGSLRRFKDDVKEVKSGFECGVGLEDFKDMKDGDIIEIYEKVEVARV